MNYRDIMLGLALCVAGTTAAAATAVEERIFSSPMPHQTSGGQVQDAVHYVRLQGRRGAGSAALMRKFIDVQLKNCTAINRAAGKPINLPKELPDFERHHIHDTYFGANRAIQYRRYYVASVNPADCSLDEKEKLTAVLSSSKGTCRIDMVEKVARGACDGAAHADAPVRRAPPTGGDPGRAGAGLDPQVAAAVARFTQSVPGAVGAPAPVPGRDGPRRVAGTPCEQIATAGGGMVCVAQTPTLSIRTNLGAMSDGRGVSRMILASTAVNGELTEEAVQAKFDQQLGDAVFGPYLRGGFKISGGSK